MGFLICFVLTMLVAKFCECKPAPYNRYPEENRNVQGRLQAALLEGDMLIGGDVSMAMTRKRGASALTIWSNGVIPYEIDSALDAYKTDIENAMREWENGTCLSFVPVSQPMPVGTGIYVKIMSNNMFGCYANVGSGDISNVPQSILPVSTLLNLATNCLTHRVILHELGHTIGFYHEQSRPDRDLYINILTENILPGHVQDFAKFSNFVIDSLGFPYDLKSVMHYGPKVWTKSADKNTIEPVDPSKTLVDNENISDIDREQVNKLYNCP